MKISNPFSSMIGFLLVFFAHFYLVYSIQILRSDRKGEGNLSVVQCCWQSFPLLLIEKCSSRSFFVPWRRSSDQDFQTWDSFFSVMNLDAVLPTQKFARLDNYRIFCNLEVYIFQIFIFNSHFNLVGNTALS